MSNYLCTIRVKATGEIVEAYAQDNFYGSHNYGFADGEKVYREEEVEVLR